MLKQKSSFLIILFLLFISCQEERKSNELKPTESKIEKEKPDHVVVISVNAPEQYYHNLNNDSLGRRSENTPGPKFVVPSPRFSFKGSQNRIEEWAPVPNTTDTLKIEVFNDIIELSTSTPFTLQRQTYLLQKGDTVVFRYDNKFPIAEVLNRKMDDAELNYTRHRLRDLFNDKFPSHMRLFLGEREDIKMEYRNTLKDTERELKFIDSLYNAGLIDSVNRAYRISAAKALMIKHSTWSYTQNLISEDEEFQQEKLHEPYYEDLKDSDSLISFHHFRDHLQSITKYNLPMISERRNSGGKYFIDSRKRFDSIVEDKRFSQFTRNHLLFDAYNGIGKDFDVEDKKKYFEKLQEEVNDRESILSLVEKYNLDFSTSDKMLLRDPNNTLTSYSEVIAANEGKIIFIEYWASWCTPCKELSSERDNLIKNVNKEEVVYIRMAINDHKEDWLQEIKDSKIKDYFIENANVSTVVEELWIATIPHFMILNHNGEVVEGFAHRPGKGALEQILAATKKSGKMNR